MGRFESARLRSALVTTIWATTFLIESQPHGARASSNRGLLGWFGGGGSSSGRRPFAWLQGPAQPPTVGICASSVIPHGYKCLEIDVTTKDGYILNLQRIPEGRRGGSGGDGATREPVLVQHGVLVDGGVWLTSSPEQNLPMILADEGFDVWIANTRGTRFSRRHETLDASQPAYWDWSWDELVSYEFPAIFDYISSQTGQKINFVGHSEATLVALAAMSEGELVSKMKSAALLCPVAYLSRMKTPLANLLAKAFVGELAVNFGLAEFNPKGAAVADFLHELCTNSGINCYDLLTGFTGKNCCLNSSTVELFLKNEPQPTATKNMVHLAQMVRNRVIAKYNYGRADYNVMHYGESPPPSYNLSKIPHDLPIFISHGGEDALSDEEDVQTLLNGLRDHDTDKISVQLVANYAHADYVMGITAKDVVYNRVVAFFKNQKR